MIFSFLRKQFIQLTIPFSWRRSCDHVADSLEQFSRVEADSAWQMLKVAELVNDEKLRCELFENALEEMHHASLFSAVAKQFRTTAAKNTSYSRKQLFHQGNDLGQFMAYQHRGEKEIHQQFDMYASASGYTQIRKIFSQIKEDESIHQEEAYLRLSGHVATNARLYLFKAALRREMERLTRMGEVVGNVVSGVILFPVYVIFGVILKTYCKKKLREPFWYTENPSLRSWKVLE